MSEHQIKKCNERAMFTFSSNARALLSQFTNQKMNEQANERAISHFLSNAIARSCAILLSRDLLKTMHKRLYFAKIRGHATGRPHNILRHLARPLVDKPMN